jgi:hypothetical protein
VDLSLKVVGVTERLGPYAVLARESGRGGGVNGELVLVPFGWGERTDAASLVLAMSASVCKRAIWSSSKAA